MLPSAATMLCISFAAIQRDENHHAILIHIWHAAEGGNKSRTYFALSHQNHSCYAVLLIAADKRLAGDPLADDEEIRGMA